VAVAESVGGPGMHQHGLERHEMASSVWQQPARLGVGKCHFYTSLSVASQASFFRNFSRAIM